MNENEWTPTEAIKRFKERDGMIAASVSGVGKGNPPYPDLPLDPVIQAKVWNVVASLKIHGTLPNDINVEQKINFRHLCVDLLEWVETFAQIPARSSQAPLAADFIRIFWGGEKLPYPQNAARFYSHLIDCLLVEILILVTIQYYKGLGFSELNIPHSFWTSVTGQTVDDLRLGHISSVNYRELYARPLIEYFAYTLRAQWDKFTRLLLLGLGLKPDFDSITEAFERIKSAEANLSRNTANVLNIYTQIGRERLGNKTWLKDFRDAIAHKTSQHSFGVFPAKNSIETTGDLWARLLDEHDYIREAMIAGFIALIFEAYKAE